MQERSFNNFSQFLNLFLAPSNITVGHIWLLFNLKILHDELMLGSGIANLHHGDSGVNLGREGDVNLVLVPVNSNPHTLLNISGGYRVSKVNNKLGKLLDIDNVPKQNKYATFIKVQNIIT